MLRLVGKLGERQHQIANDIPVFFIGRLERNDLARDQLGPAAPFGQIEFLFGVLFGGVDGRW